MSSSPFPSCFRPTGGDNHLHPPPSPSLPPPPPPPPPISGKSNLTTCIYQTELGLFSLTWSRTFLGHSLNLNLHHPLDYHHHHHNSLSTQLSLSSIISFHVNINSYLFWKKHGSKKLHFTNIRQSDKSDTATTTTIKVLWDLTGAKFGSGPEPVSGFYIAVVVNREMVLVVGDKSREAYKKSRASVGRPERRNGVAVLREEHVYGNRVYVTKARFGNRNREISIDCNTNSEGSLCFYVDKHRVLKVKKLKWKFRGNERVEVDGVHINISWNVHSWLFEGSNNNGHAVFMFRFETLDNEEEQGERERDCYHSDKNSEVMSCSSDVVDQEKNGNGGGVVLWSHKSFSGAEVNGGGVSSEWRKIRKSLMKMRTARSSSSSSISMSSASSGCSSSVMEWSSVEETELTSAVGFSLLVRAWRK